MAALCEFVRLHPSPQERNLEGLRTLKNDIITVLREQAAPMAGLTELLIGIYDDKAQDPVTRDYAIQHLILWCGQGPADAKRKIHAVLNMAAREKTSVAGTALLGLHRLSAEDAAFNRDEVRSIALRLASASETEPATRATAVQVCAERGIREALPMIETLAQTSGDMALQLSAIAALGHLGGAEQAVLLERLEPGANGAVLRASIRAARKRLSQKQERLF